MKSATPKILLSFAAVFLLGAVSGGSLARVLHLPQGLRQFSEKTVLGERLKKDISRLNLTTEQAASLRVQFQGMEGELREIREDTNRRIKEAFDRRMEAVRPELTSAQRSTYEEFGRERSGR